MAILSFSVASISPNGYKTFSTCAEIIHTYEKLSCNFTRSLPRLLERYPACTDLNGSDGKGLFVVVNASLDVKKPEEIFSMLSLVYGVSAFSGLMIHVIGVEVYLHGLREEHERSGKGESLASPTEKPLTES